MDSSTIDAAAPIANGLANGVTNGVSNGLPLNTVPKPRPVKGARTAGDALLDDSFYPLQRGPYISPSCRLSAESKRLVRLAQEPILASSPATVHHIYDVGLIAPFVSVCACERGFSNPARRAYATPRLQTRACFGLQCAA